MLHRDLGQDEGIGHLGVVVPVAGEAVVLVAALHLAQDLLVPVHIIVLGFFLALADQFFQNRLSVFDGGREHLFPVFRHLVRVKGIVVPAVAVRVGVHHQALPQGLVICPDQHRHEALVGGVPLGVAVGRHDGVIVLHGGEIGAFAVQILHQSLGQLRRLQRVLVEVLPLPVGEAFFDHLCHGLVVVLVKGDKQVRLVLDLVGVVALLPDDADGVAVDVAGEEWTFLTIGICTIVVGGKGPSHLVEHRAGQLPVQLIPDKRPQVYTGRISLDLFYYLFVLREEFFTHQVMLHAPAQVDGHVVVGIDLVHRQVLLPDGLQVPVSAIHFHHAAVLHAAKFAHSHGVGTGIVSHKTNAVHFVEQGICAMLYFIFQFIPVEGDHLIEVDLLAAGQDADLAAIFGVLWACQNGSAQLCALCKVLLMVHGVAKAQPGIAGNGQAGQGFQQADGPVPPLIFQVLMLQFPVSRQSNGQFRPLQLVFGQLLRHIHPVSAHTHGDQGVVVPLLGGRNNADIHMNVRGRKLMEHILELAEILLDVPLDSFHLLLGVDLGNAGLLVLGAFPVRTIAAGFPGDLQGHLILRQADAGAAGDGVLVILLETDGLPVVELHIVLQHIGGKAGQEVPQDVGVGTGTQHLHLVLSERLHAVGVAVQTVLIPPEAEPDPVEDGQLAVLYRISKALIELGFKHHAAGIDAGGILLPAAGGHYLGEQPALFQKILLLAQYRHHQVGAVRLGRFDRILPHIVVFRVGLGFAAGDRVFSQTDGGQHVAHLKHQGVVILFLAGIVFLYGDVPLFLHIPDELLLVPFSLGQQYKAGENAGAVRVRFLGRFRLIVFIFVETGFRLQPADELLEAVRQMGDLVVVFLIHMDHRRLPLGTAGPVVQEDHVVPGAGAVADGHADGRISPLIDHKLAPQFSAEGASLLPSDAEDAGDGHMILCPTGGFVSRVAVVHRDAAVVLLHEPDIGGGQLVAQFFLHTGDQLVGRRVADIFL